MNIAEAQLIYFAGIFGGIICTFLVVWLFNKGKKKVIWRDNMLGEYTVAYLCDQKKCENCTAKEEQGCRHTTDPEHVTKYDRLLLMEKFNETLNKVKEVFDIDYDGKELYFMEKEERMHKKFEIQKDTGMLTKEDFEYWETIASNLRSMTVVTGLCRTEKETLNEAANFITDIIESTGYSITDEEKERTTIS